MSYSPGWKGLIFGINNVNYFFCLTTCINKSSFIFFHDKVKRICATCKVKLILLSLITFNYWLKYLFSNLSNNLFRRIYHIRSRLLKPTTIKRGIGRYYWTLNFFQILTEDINRKVRVSVLFIECEDQLCLSIFNDPLFELSEGSAALCKRLEKIFCSKSVPSFLLGIGERLIEGFSWL